MKIELNNNGSNGQTASQHDSNCIDVDNLDFQSTFNILSFQLKRQKVLLNLLNFNRYYPQNSKNLSLLASLLIGLSDRITQPQNDNNSYNLSIDKISDFLINLSLFIAATQQNKIVSWDSPAKNFELAFLFAQIIESILRFLNCLGNDELIDSIDIFPECIDDENDSRNDISVTESSIDQIINRDNNSANNKTEHEFDNKNKKIQSKKKSKKETNDTVSITTHDTKDNDSADTETNSISNESPVFTEFAKINNSFVSIYDPSFYKNWLPSQSISSLDLEIYFNIISLSILSISKLFGSQKGIYQNPFLILFIRLWKKFTKLLLLSLHIDRKNEILQNTTIGTPKIIYSMARGCSSVRYILSAILNQNLDLRFHDLVHESFNAFTFPIARKFIDGGSLKIETELLLDALLSHGFEFNKVSNLLLNLDKDDQYDVDLKYMFEFEDHLYNYTVEISDDDDEDDDDDDDDDNIDEDNHINNNDEENSDYDFDTNYHNENNDNEENFSDTLVYQHYFNKFINNNRKVMIKNEITNNLNINDNDDNNDNNITNNEFGAQDNQNNYSSDPIDENSIDGNSEADLSDPPNNNYNIINNNFNNENIKNTKNINNTNNNALIGQYFKYSNNYIHCDCVFEDSDESDEDLEKMELLVVHDLGPGKGEIHQQSFTFNKQEIFNSDSNIFTNINKINNKISKNFKDQHSNKNTKISEIDNEKHLSDINNTEQNINTDNFKMNKESQKMFENLPNNSKMMIFNALEKEKEEIKNKTRLNNTNSSKQQAVSELGITRKLETKKNQFSKTIDSNNIKTLKLSCISNTTIDNTAFNIIMRSKIESINNIVKNNLKFFPEKMEESDKNININLGQKPDDISDNNFKFIAKLNNEDEMVLDLSGDRRDVPRGMNIFFNPLRNLDTANCMAWKELSEAFDKMAQEPVSDKLGEQVVSTIARCIKLDHEMNVKRSLLSLKDMIVDSNKIGENDINKDSHLGNIPGLCHMENNHNYGEDDDNDDYDDNQMVTFEKIYDRWFYDSIFEPILRYNPDIACAMMDEMLMAQGYRRPLIWFISHLEISQSLVNYIHELTIRERGNWNDYKYDYGELKNKKLLFSREGLLELSDVEVNMLLHEFFSNAGVYLTKDFDIEIDESFDTNSGKHNDKRINGKFNPNNSSKGHIDGQVVHENNAGENYKSITNFLDAKRLVSIICLMIKSLADKKVISLKDEDYQIELQILLIDWVGILPAARELYFYMRNNGKDSSNKTKTESDDDDDDDASKNRVQCSSDLVSEYQALLEEDAVDDVSIPLTPEENKKLDEITNELVRQLEKRAVGGNREVLQNLHQFKRFLKERNEKKAIMVMLD
ncbi:CCR4-NOT core subunit CAF130 ASCRUDRAFT_143714 [Ascoidea rubescens DSM 1968]|uniref:Uncharacterized protein n=1 Tax=Ascoidea rubescens DSM 1968 TaxID=1344418 RepID=A0A1D2VJ15_9ASCO|nr:hypothetical protein ASCRUDRAFT_143714 [Ascoidea rubescens DSM 1968]ODV61621.1 hypothetical protein ASCRUDRAFT_143714 [Ascoidea rubescens DSM 1968]